ncbi:cation channel family protein (macronuclear) [Tetrahymena thermophila SB210]|uniref:Cation channel family protein n=1 Tax=Tetrahymena thermophila (strain SB210) TaxID=312017 RepID=Q233Q3_TETTS|nr:cation channel family protein [Tetrahymena thermophila SB210]EAR91776.2 cation channel family protein [Tetrahymena thermophila SB210]|eukprot:XP_001012021.2 cation channel family protein [Tetrahymena thermophila SB210]
MERRANLIQRLYQEEKQKCNSLININQDLQHEKQGNKNQNKSTNKQTSSQETSILKIKQPSIDAIQATNKKMEIKRLNLQKTYQSKDFDSENEMKWNRLNDIIKRIKFKKYIKTFLSLSRIRLEKHLTPSQIQKINDLSYSCNSYSTNKEIEYKVGSNNIQDNSSNALLNLFHSIKIPIFLPHSLLYEIWTFVKITSAMICFYCYLVCFALNKDLEQLFPIQLLVICQLCIFLDIFITLNTGIYIKGILCKDRKDLFNYYKSSKTIYYDFCSTFFTTLYYLFHFNGFQHSQALMVLLLPIIFKHNDFYVIIKKLKQKFLLDRRAQNIIELINLLKNILLISHIFACIWLFVGLMSDENNIQSNNSANSQPQSWLELVDIQNSPWYVQYLNSYYYIAVTMSTVGYGDIRATNPIEVLVAVFFVMTCSVIFGFTLNNIGEIFQDFFQFEKQIQEKRYVIANYMNKNGINQETRQSIFEYLEYYWKDKINENTQEENNIISQLSDNLKEELLIQSNRLIFKQNRVLRDNFSQEILTKCLPIIQEMRFTQNEIIIDESTGNSDFSIYFVLQGEIEVIHRQNHSIPLNNSSNKQMKQTNNKYKEIAILSQGDSFGEKSFFSGFKQSLTFRSKKFSKVLKIKRDDFISILQGDQEQYEIFCSINDRLMFCSDQSFLQLQCKSCKDSSHDIVQCPYLHLIPRKLKLLSNIKNSQPHLDRNAFKRRLYKQGALENNDLIQSSLYEFIENKEDEIIQYENQYYTYRQFLGSKTYFVSDEEADQIPKSLKESIKERRAPTSEISDSPQMNASKKFNFSRRIGFMLNTNSTNQQGNASTKDQINYISCNSLDDFQLNAPNLVQGQNRITLSRDLDAVVRQNSESDIKFEFPPSQSSTSIIEKQIQQSRQQFFKMQMLKEGNRVQFEKVVKQKTQEQKEKPQQHFQQLKQDYTDYDLFGGDFEKMAIFTKYFPKYNYKNVVSSLQQQKQPKYQMKDSINIPVNRKINRNIQSIINREKEVVSCRSLPRMKIKGETPTSRENTINKSQHNVSNGGANNFSQMMKFRVSHQDSIIMNESNLDVVMEKQLSYEEPNTPPRNEYNISKQAINSLANFKTSQYNFGNIEDSQLVTIRKEYIDSMNH